MQNRIAETIAGLIGQANRITAGLQKHGADIGINAVTAADLIPEITGYIYGDKVCSNAKTKLSLLRATANDLVDSAIDYVRLTRDVLKPRLGKRHSIAWGDVGLVRSLAVPLDVDDLLAVLPRVAAYFADHPEQQNAPLNIVGSRATTFYNDINAARAAVNAQKTVLKDALAARDAHGAKVRKMIRAVIKELSIRVDPLDNRYPAFGLNRPGRKATPDVPANVEAVIVHDNAAAVKWSRSPRADHYRLWKRVVGVDADFVAAGSPTDLDCMLEDLPRGRIIELALSAVNNGGESARSEVVTVNTV